MTAEAEKLLREALNLSDADKRRIAEVLLDTVPPESTDDIARAWEEVARRRADEVERGEVVPLDARAELVELRKKLKARRQVQ